MRCTSAWAGNQSVDSGRASQWIGVGGHVWWAAALQPVGWTEPAVGREGSLGCGGSGVAFKHTAGTPARNPHEVGLGATFS